MKHTIALKILSDHRAELRQRYSVKSLALFGSVVRDEAKSDSDVDVLVEFDRPITLFDLVAVKQYLESLLGVDKVDVVMRDAIYPALRETILSEAVDVA